MNKPFNERPHPIDAEQLDDCLSVEPVLFSQQPSMRSVALNEKHGMMRASVVQHGT